MTPVEKGSIELGLTLNLLESSKFIFFASTIPFFPVPAFALPELITSNLGLIFVKFCLANITGAAAHPGTRPAHPGTRPAHPGTRPTDPGTRPADIQYFRNT